MTPSWAAHRRVLLRAALFLAAVLGAAVPGEAAAQQELPQVFGRDSLLFRGVSANVGRIWPREVDPALEVDLRADLGPVAPAVHLVPFLSFWSSQFQTARVRGIADRVSEICARQYGTACPVVDLGEVRISDLSLGINLEYGLPPHGRVRPFAAVGGGVHLLNGQGDAIDGTFIEGILDAVAPGLSTALGVEVGVIRSLRLRAEGRAVLASYTRSVALSLGGSIAVPVRVSDPASSEPSTDLP